LKTVYTGKRVLIYVLFGNNSSGPLLMGNYQRSTALRDSSLRRKHVICLLIQGPARERTRTLEEKDPTL